LNASTIGQSLFRCHVKRRLSPRVPPLETVCNDECVVIVSVQTMSHSSAIFKIF